MACLRSHAWPGNVRELERRERACILSIRRSSPGTSALLLQLRMVQALNGLDLSGTLSDVATRALRLVERRKASGVVGSQRRQ
jgi:DNA-binding NtrC family response regulator